MKPPMEVVMVAVAIEYRGSEKRRRTRRAVRRGGRGEKAGWRLVGCER
jgi:hypothetical protein